MNRKIGVIILLLAFGVLFFSSVLAQSDIPDTGVPGQGGVVEKVDELKEFASNFTEEERWEYLGESWKKELLKNKLIVVFDDIFRRLDVYFVILMGVHYDFSAVVLIIVLLWIITATTFEGYFTFMQNENTRALASIAAAVILAHAKVLYFIAKGLFKVSTLLFLGREGGIWSLLSLLVAIVGVFAYYYINKLLERVANSKLGEVTERTMSIQAELEALRQGAE